MGRRGGGPVSTNRLTYAGKSVTGAYAIGDILYQGQPKIAFYNSVGTSIAGPGGEGVAGNDGTTLQLHALLGSLTGGPNTVARGTRVSIKGRYVNRSDTILSATHEAIGLGVVISAAAAADMTATLETTRDDSAAVAVIVDATENIRSFNCAAAGDAAYTDSGFDADLSAGIYWEIIISCPGAGNTHDDMTVTIKIGANTILNAVAPVSVAAGTALTPFFTINQAGYISDVTMKIERVA